MTVKTTLDDPVALAAVLRSTNGLPSPTQALVLRWLARHAKAGPAKPNIAQIGRDLGLTRQAASRAMRRLRERGFLEIRERRETAPPKPARERVVRLLTLRLPAEARQLYLPLTAV